MRCTEEVTRVLGRKYLGPKGQIYLEALLAEGRERLARVYLLGAIDSTWVAGNVPDEEARDDYLKLSFDSDELKNALTKKGYRYHEQFERVRTSSGIELGRYLVSYAVRTGEKPICLGIKGYIMKRNLKAFMESDAWKQLS